MILLSFIEYPLIEAQMEFQLSIDTKMNGYFFGGRICIAIYDLSMGFVHKLGFDFLIILKNLKYFSPTMIEKIKKSFPKFMNSPQINKKNINKKLVNQKRLKART